MGPHPVDDGASTLSPIFVGGTVKIHLTSYPSLSPRPVGDTSIQICLTSPSFSASLVRSVWRVTLHLPSFISPFPPKDPEGLRPPTSNYISGDCTDACSITWHRLLSQWLNRSCNKVSRYWWLPGWRSFTFLLFVNSSTTIHHSCTQARSLTLTLARAPTHRQCGFDLPHQQLSTHKSAHLSHWRFGISNAHQLQAPAA